MKKKFRHPKLQNNFFSDKILYIERAWSDA